MYGKLVIYLAIVLICSKLDDFELRNKIFYELIHRWKRYLQNVLYKCEMSPVTFIAIVLNPAINVRGVEIFFETCIIIWVYSMKTCILQQMLKMSCYMIIKLVMKLRRILVIPVSYNILNSYSIPIGRQVLGIHANIMYAH